MFYFVSYSYSLKRWATVSDSLGILHYVQSAFLPLSEQLWLLDRRFSPLVDFQPLSLGYESEKSLW